MTIKKKEFITWFNKDQAESTLLTGGYEDPFPTYEEIMAMEQDNRPYFGMEFLEEAWEEGYKLGKGERSNERSCL